MTKFAVLELYTVRCWRQESDYNEDIEIQTSDEIRDVLMEFEPKIHSVTKKDIAVRLLEIDRMNAVEVLDNESSDGLVVYADWP